MGLQSQLNDFSSDSLPLFLLSLLASSISFLLRFLHSPRAAHHPRLSPNLNGVLSYRFYAPAAAPADSDCVVCLSPLSSGDHVSRLPCRHVFHTPCLHAWLHRLNFNCPLCRSPLSASPSRAAAALLMPPVPSS